MNPTRLDLRVADGVAHLRLNRPDAANAIDDVLARELMEVTVRLTGDPGVRSVLLSGVGEMFCAGGDVKSFAGVTGDLGGHLLELTTYLHAAISRLVSLDAPVVTAVHGSAAGAGFSLACASDIVIAAESARFVMAYTKLGLSPDGSATWFLPRRIGLGRALELTLTNRVLSAQEAFDWGIVNQVVSDDELYEAAFEFARELAAGPTLAFGASKRLLRQSATESLETQMERESKELAGAARSSDAREGILAFTEKRRPVFGGR